MRAGTLKMILERLDDEYEIMMEHCPAPDEYIMEYILGARNEGDKLVLFGITRLL